MNQMHQARPSPRRRTSGARRQPIGNSVDGSGLSSLRLTERDCQIVLAVATHRLLTAAQVEALLFAGSMPATGKPTSTRCLHRLRLLCGYGFLARTSLPYLVSSGRAPYIYLLDHRGAELLGERYGMTHDELDWQPWDNDISPWFVEHTLLTNDLRVTLTLAARQRGCRIESWIDEKTLRTRLKDVVTIQGPEGRRQRAAIVPDGFFTLHDGTHLYDNFVEIDRATTTGQASVWGRRDWTRRVLAYQAYHHSGMYQARFASDGFRVLTVTVGQTRGENLKRITEEAGGRARFWFTTVEKVTPATILTEPIWRVAGSEELHPLIW